MFEVEDLNPATEVGPARLPWQLLHPHTRAGAGAGAGAGARADLTRLASFACLAARATASTR